MGYTTKFAGRFTFDRQLTLDEMNILKDICDDDSDACDAARKLGAPVNSFCQWEPTKDGRALQWDGGEKFYDYEEWLRFLVDKTLKPWGVAVTGEVTWQGEEIGDVGTLRVKDGVVTATKLEPKGTKVECPECEHEFYVGGDP